ncbi:MAG: NAD-dependent epimerase/dehydratase family protein [Deltaproteobacteria bacterium]|nr:NAD-dependent epimerase/dehydratase family protein [Deltaproteobacteria bacterium]
MVLVTGGTGFLGQHVIEELLSRGQAVRALVRRPSRILARMFPALEQVSGDVQDLASLPAALAGARRVFHLAGLVSRDPKDATRMMRIHVDGTRNVLRAACEAGVDRVVLASSSGTVAVSKDPERVLDESAPFALELVKGWPYYLSKIYQEQLALDVCGKEKLPLVIMSPSLLLGPGDARGSSTEDVRRFLQRKIPICPEGGVNFVDVRDVATAFASAMENGRDGERYLLGGPNWTLETFFGRLERLSKVPAPRLRVPDKVARWGAILMEQFADWRGVAPPVDRISVEMAQHFWYVDSSKAMAELSFEPRDPQETLMDTIRYVRRHFLGEAGQDEQVVNG